jgi:hypothetical protein
VPVVDCRPAACIVAWQLDRTQWIDAQTAGTTKQWSQV